LALNKSHIAIKNHHCRFSGFVGSSLVSFLKDSGHDVIQLVRNKNISYANCVYWNPELEQIDFSLLEDADAIINLSGENIHSLWTSTKKR
jgi:NAD dependent epimerase/dehydratase family enzyme